MSAELVGLYGALPKTTRGRATVLTGKADKKKILYAHGAEIFIRDIDDPSKCEVFSDHNKNTTMAKYSPSGFYIASADVTGKIKIWDTVNPEHITRNEVQPFAGEVMDLDWSDDSQRMVAGGQGRETFVKAFNAETGTSLGEMIGHMKPLNSVSFKSSRPFRIVTGSEDYSVCFYQGPPFKYDKKIAEHKNFVNCVRYSPDGSKFATASSDGRAFVYEGKTAEKLLELGSPAHKGGIYSLCFSPDNKEILTASGDKTAKIWNAESGELVVEFVLGKDISDMQLGCVWVGEHIVTLSLSGHLNYLDRNDPATPARIVMGHSKVILSVAMEGDTLYTADGEGRVCVWDTNTGACTRVTGKGHEAQVQSVSLSGNQLVTCSIDDTMREINTETRSYSDVCVKMSSQPQCVTTSPNGYTAVACLGEILLLQNGRLICSKTVEFSPSSVSIHPNEVELAVGGTNDKSVHIYSIQNGDLVETNCIKHIGAVTCLAYSPDGAYLATGDGNRNVSLYSYPDYNDMVSGQWSSHTAKVLCLAWSPNSQQVASGSLDTSVFVWNVNDIRKKIKMDHAHKRSAVSALAWKDDNIVISAGHDANIRLWKVSL